MDAREEPGEPGPGDSEAAGLPPELVRGLEALWERLARLEHAVPVGLRHLPREVGREALPAWRRVTQGEPRWRVSLAVLAAIALQLPVPDRLVLVHPIWLLPAFETLLLIGL